MHYLRILILPIFLFAYSCDTVSIQNMKEVQRLVERDLVRFTPTELPNEIIEASVDATILMIGETHYVQEHHEFVLTILEGVQSTGYRVVANELSQAMSWMAEDYVTGKLDDIPNYIRFFNNHVLEELRENNKGKDEPIVLKFFDANQKGAFPFSLDEITKVLGQDPLLNIVDGILVDSEKYLKKLEELDQELTENSNVYINKWGALWFDRILEMTKVEINSIAWRKSNQGLIREGIMRDNLDRIKDEYQKVVVNCGMYHAQKSTHMGESINRLAGYYKPDEVYSIAFSAIKGERKKNFYDENTILFDTIMMAKKRNLIKIIGELAGENMGFVEMTDPQYKETFEVMYLSGVTKQVPPGKQFDAIVTYPTVSLLESMSAFNYQ